MGIGLTISQVEVWPASPRRCEKHGREARSSRPSRLCQRHLPQVRRRPVASKAASRFRKFASCTGLVGARNAMRSRVGSISCGNVCARSRQPASRRSIMARMHLLQRPQLYSGP